MGDLLSQAQVPGAVVFTELAAVHKLVDKLSCPVVVIVDDTLAAIQALTRNPWLSHLVPIQQLESAPQARAHFETLLARLEHGPDCSMVEVEVGRVVRLSSSARRESRLERIRDFYTRYGVTGRALSVICDVAEELVTNALYDAPADAGYFEPKSRAEQVDLEPDRACEISYGVNMSGAFIRVRDPFGAFTRDRLLAVLNRCTADGVALDESRGGAGLGIWRIFSAASILCISVVPQKVTDIIVEIPTKGGRPSKPAASIHMFFTPKPIALDLADAFESALIDDSVSIARVA